MSVREEKKFEVEESEVRNIITPALPGGSACPLILRGLLYGKCDPTPFLDKRGTAEGGEVLWCNE